MIHRKLENMAPSTRAAAERLLAGEELVIGQRNSWSMRQAHKFQRADITPPMARGLVNEGIAVIDRSRGYAVLKLAPKEDA